MIQTVREAWELWERLDAAVQSEEVPLEEAFGRVLAEDVIAGRDVPAFRRSPYDGYALSSADSRGASRERPAVFHVNEEVPAGSVHPARYSDEGDDRRDASGGRGLRREV